MKSLDDALPAAALSDGRLSPPALSPGNGTRFPWWKEPTRGQWAAYLAAWIGWVLDAFDFTIFLLVMPKIADEFHVNATTATVSVTLTLLVRLLGGYVAGIAADRWGRKLPLMLSIVWFALCDGAVAFAPSFTVVLVLRTLFGFGMGAEWTSGATLAMESWPERSRGLASGFLQGSWAIGHLLAGVVAAWVVPTYGWRALFLIAAIPALLAIPIRFWVPESPDWRREAAKKLSVPLMKALFSEGLWVRVGWASLLLAAGFGAYYGLVSLYSMLLQKELGFTQQAVGGFTAAFNIGMLLGAVLCGTLASKKGAALAIGLPSLLALPVLPLYVGSVHAGLSPNGALALGAFLGGALGVGSSGVTPLLLTSLFPPGVRARCVGLVYHLGASLASLAPPLVAWLHDYQGLSYARAILWVVGISELLIVLILVLRPRFRPSQRAQRRTSGRPRPCAPRKDARQALLPGPTAKQRFRQRE